ncbi:hypothetical protein LguiA_023880 [Lonicera macranthoides]
MDPAMKAGRRIWFVFAFLATLLLLSCYANADEVIREVSDPTGNVNLSPFQQWRSAYECLQNISNRCPEKYRLTEEGWMHLNQTDTAEYCKAGGCLEHTRAVLLCIHEVKRDYKFIDKTTVPQLNNTITLGCDQGFTGSVIPVFSGGGRVYESRSALFFLMVAALFLMAYF